jgi:hypothetical protein
MVHPSIAVSTALSKAGLKVTARVFEDPKTTDLAITGAGSEFVILRCVNKPRAIDQDALKTMVSEGDFDRAFLVHAGEEADLAGAVQTWPLSRVSELVEVIAKGGGR